MLNNMIKNVLALVPVALTAQARSILVGPSTLEYFAVSGGLEVHRGEIFSLEMHYNGDEGMWNTREVTLGNNHFDLQFENECHLKNSCVIVWTFQAGDELVDSIGITIRKPDGEKLRIPVAVVDHEEGTDEVSGGVCSCGCGGTTHDSDARRL